MRRLMPIGVLIVACWLLCAVVVVIVSDPGEHLVGAKRYVGATAPVPLAGPADVAGTLSLLEKTSLWGLQRNGQPIPPPKPKEVEEKEKTIVWAVIATVVRKDQRFVLVKVENDAPRPVVEGESLPDGSKLRKVLTNAYVVESTDGDGRTVTSHFIASGK